MFTLILTLLILTCVFGVAFKLTGTLLKALVWVTVLLPIGIVLGCLGLVCCCTIFLIPVGVSLMKAGIHVIIPG